MQGYFFGVPMRLLMIVLNVAIAATTCLIIYDKLNEPSPIIVVPVESKPEPRQSSKIIVEYNQINSVIKNFACDSVDVKIWQNGMRHKISGVLFYEKTSNLRMRIRSLMGEELDLGSNKDVFWYWSRRDTEPGIHYARHEDHNKTRLKTPFDPVFMMESLGYETIDEKSEVTETTNYFVVSTEKLDGCNRKVKYLRFISKTSKRLIAMTITDQQENVLAISKIEYIGILPSKITCDWREEHQILSLEFKYPETNTTISEKNWQMPTHHRQINMIDSF